MIHPHIFCIRNSACHLIIWPKKQTDHNFYCLQNRDAKSIIEGKHNLMGDHYLLSLTAQWSSLSVQTFRELISMVTRILHKSQDQTSSFWCDGRGSNLTWSESSCLHVSFRPNSRSWSLLGAEQNQLSRSKTLSRNRCCTWKTQSSHCTVASASWVAWTNRQDPRFVAYVERDKENRCKQGNRCRRSHQVGMEVIRL